MNNEIQKLADGAHDRPNTILGCHKVGENWEVRAWLPTALHAEINGKQLENRGNGFYVGFFSEDEKCQLDKHYTLIWGEHPDQRIETICPYSFSGLIGELDLHLFGEGKHWQIYQVLGAHKKCIDGVEGTHFAVWAPEARRVSVVGTFNNWHGLRHPMNRCSDSGVWELFIPGVCEFDLYKYEILSKVSSTPIIKTDPYAQAMELRPETGSVVSSQTHQWSDQKWMRQREAFDWQKSPINIYEVHIGSWQREDDGSFLNYREIAHRLVEYVKWMGYTHIELMPIMEHPLDASWGYQVSGYFAPSSRYGSPDDFRYFIDHCHQHNIGVFLDWVPAHFPKDAFALARFDGSALYEHEDSRKGEHKDWGTYIFNFGRNEVKNFLIANALYWLQEFHIDGLRVDAVASMLYLNYSRKDGEWEANEYGGHENLEAISFLRELNVETHKQHPGTVMMAEESTSWPMVSRPIEDGGLGFSMKWNMGWMHDTLEYLKRDPIYRPYHHHELTFSQNYAYSENFILPLSHDEVVHLKCSLSGKMPGDDWKKLANLKLLIGYQMLHPGKKLMFMGGEFGQWTEWNEDESISWFLCGKPENRGVQLLSRDLNALYHSRPALHLHDFEQEGFEWIDCNDNEKSLYSFVRKTKDESLICIFNFMPVARENFRVGVPEKGAYIEVVNSDSELYNGSEICNEGQMRAETMSWMNRPYSLKLDLPALGFVVLEKK